MEATSFLTVAESLAMKDMILTMRSLNSSYLDLSWARDWKESNNSKLRIKILCSFSPQVGLKTVIDNCETVKFCAAFSLMSGLGYVRLCVGKRFLEFLEGNWPR